MRNLSVGIFMLQKVKFDRKKPLEKSRIKLKLLKHAIRLKTLIILKSTQKIYRSLGAFITTSLSMRRTRSETSINVFKIHRQLKVLYPDSWCLY